MKSKNFTISEQPLRVQAKNAGVTHFSTGAAIIKSGKILLIRRVSHDFLGGNYELPGGGVEESETFEEAVKREIFEETGLKSIRILDMFDGFDYTTGSKPKVRQLNFMVETTSSDVVLDPNEHDSFVWVGPGDFSELSVSDEIKLCLKKAFTIGSDGFGHAQRT